MDETLADSERIAVVHWNQRRMNGLGEGKKGKYAVKSWGVASHSSEIVAKSMK